MQIDPKVLLADQARELQAKEARIRELEKMVTEVQPLMEQSAEELRRANLCIARLQSKITRLEGPKRRKR